MFYNQWQARIPIDKIFLKFGSPKITMATSNLRLYIECLHKLAEPGPTSTEILRGI